MSNLIKQPTMTCPKLGEIVGMKPKERVERIIR